VDEGDCDFGRVEKAEMERGGRCRGRGERDKARSWWNVWRERWMREMKVGEVVKDKRI
jgi:hypothetical protein